MDLINIPACALYRNIGTVIVRTKKMEMFEEWQYLGSGHRSVCKEPVHRPSGCELCIRTRLISKRKSDCDSVVKRHRPYRSSSARSRYFNVCAAVCSFLVFGSLSPQSSAAPTPRRTAMANMRAAWENPLWANPCDYAGAPPNISPDQSKDIATKLSAQAKNAYSAAASYKDQLAKQLHSYDKFDDLLKVWEKEEWLRAFKWYQDGVLPIGKQLYYHMADANMSAIMSRPDIVLPAMFKALKMIVASLNRFANEGLEDSIVSDESLKDNLNKTMHDARAVLCYFSDYMKSRGFPIEPVTESEIPDFSNESTMLVTGLLVYRDTLNFLEYLSQAFTKLE